VLPLTGAEQGAALLSRPLLLSFRNTFRKKGRLLLTLFTLSMAGAVFIAVFNVRSSMTYLMDLMMQHFMADVTVTLRQPYRVERVEQALLETPGVAQVEAWGGAPGELWDAGGDLVTKITVVAPPEGTHLLRPDMVAGRWVRPGEDYALVAGDTIYKYYPHLQPGDQVRVKLPGRKVESWTVVGVFRFMGMLPEPLVYANFGFVSGRIHLRNQAASYRVVTTQHDSAGQRAISRAIDAHLKERNLPVQSVISGGTMLENATTGLNALIIFLLIMAVLTAIVGSIGLTGTMSINVLERRREIGVMRTIGAQDRVIMQAVMIEALVIGLITWLLAIGLSLPIGALMLRIIGQAMMGSPTPQHITPLGMLLWLGVVSVLSLFASLAPARSAARLTINEVLAYE